MPDVIVVFSRWGKWIATVTIAATLLALVVVQLMPRKYISIATALPASSMATDKASVFNTNIQELYSSLGTADDLDRIIGTAHLDTIYIAVADSLNLAAHYHLPKDKAVQKLKRHTAVSKSEWGELKLKVWDSDRNTAAQAANGLLKKLQELHQALQNKSNEIILERLKETYNQELQQTDTTLVRPTLAAKAAQAEQLRNYEKLLSEYNLMVTTNPPVLLVVENARAASRADTSEKWAAVVVTFFAAFLFSTLLSLYAEGKKARA